MLWGCFRSGIHALALLGSALVVCPLLAAKPADTASVPPAAPAWTFDLPLFTYPEITPEKAKNARSLNTLRDFRTATDSPRWPTPNEWLELDLYQGTLTRQQFEQKLSTLYDPFHIFPAYYEIDDSKVVFYPSAKERRVPQFVLNFAPPDKPRAPMRWFRTPAEFRAESRPLDKPLNGLRIAIDPGHIGGPWAQIEERSTRYKGSAPVQEGDMNLITARILKQQLTNLGATVFVVRDSTEPVTPYRPHDMIPEARELLVKKAGKGSALQTMAPDKVNVVLGSRLMELAKFLFYRCSEIKERGNRIRNNFVPDITVTLYIDATPGSGRGRLTPGNANIFFVGGSYTKTEMADPEMQRRCVYKMLEGGSEIEIELANDIANAFTQKTGLKPVRYGDSSTTRAVIPSNPYVVARNLAANREYDGPVVCTEPYFMNNEVVYQRLLAGDYEGQKIFNKKSYSSIFREYADCVTQGLLKTYSGSTVIAGATPAPSADAGQPK